MADGALKFGQGEYMSTSIEGRRGGLEACMGPPAIGGSGSALTSSSGAAVEIETAAF